MTLSNSTTATPRIVDADDATGRRNRPLRNGQERMEAGDQLAASALAVADPPHRPHRVAAKPATPSPSPRHANGDDVEASSVEPSPLAAPTNGNGVAVGQGKRRSAAMVASRQTRSGALENFENFETMDRAESDADGLSAAEAGPREPLTFVEVQEAHAAAARTFRDIRRSLNESYRLIGRLNVERYELQVELAELKGLPMPERPPERSWNAAETPVAPLAAQRLQRNRQEPDEDEDVDEDVVRAIGRKRQLTLLVAVAATALFALIYWLVGWHWFPNITDREAMTDIAGIGMLMQVFFLVFFLFRLGMLTTKGRSWLFPTAEAETFKRRRKRLRGH